LEIRTFTTKEFAELLGRKTRTLYSWQRSGKLVPQKSWDGRNIYTTEDYKTVTGQELQFKT
jgi:DNA-binding transcriptional MerR regulator